MIGVVWHYWIAVAIVIPALILVSAMIVGYVTKVSKPRYPKS
jgi:amino acid permease